MRLCYHPSTLILEHFYHANNESLAFTSFLPALDNYLSVFSIDLPLLNILCKWNHKICSFEIDFNSNFL